MTAEADAHYRVLAERLILACLTNDHDAHGIVEAEIGDCEHCWREVTATLAAAAAVSRLKELSGPDAAIACTQDCIAYDLDWLAAATGGTEP